MEIDKNSETNSQFSSLPVGKASSEFTEGTDRWNNLPYIGTSFSSASTVGKCFNQKRKARLKRSPGPLDENTLKGVAEYIKSGKCKNIIVLTGAGISTAAGIPDFRTPGSGVYSNVDKYNIPSAESLFDIDYFKLNPKPLYSLFKSHMEVFFQAKPTFTHYFIQLLAKKGILLRNYTQNVDGIERSINIDPSYLVEAHGTFSTASCIDCHAKTDLGNLITAIIDEKLCVCSLCGSLIKPDMVFFGERLPEYFYESVEHDCKKCDLMIITGTSLCVYPVSLITQLIPPDVPRLLINREKVGSFRFDDDTSTVISESSSQYDQRKDSDPYGSVEDQCQEINANPEEFTDENQLENMDLVIYDRDVVWLGHTEEGFKELANLLGWSEEIEVLMKQEYSSPFLEYLNSHPI